MLPIQNPDNLFHDGVPGGELGTVLTAAWLNAMQGENLSILQAAGIAPSAATNQLLQALSSAGVFQTAPQFDATTKPATMAAVQRALGSLNGYTSLSSSRALIVNDIGKAIFATSGAWTFTLPTPTSLGVPVGGAFTIFGTVGSSSSVVPGAGASINVSGSVANVPILAGQSATFVAVTATTWQVVNSTAALSANADFAASLAANGYQKLPSGLIVQWGLVDSPVNSTTTISLPIAFPNAFLSVVVSCDDNVGAVSSSPFSAAMRINKSSFSLRSYYSQSNIRNNWIALGN